MLSMHTFYRIHIQNDQFSVGFLRETTFNNSKILTLYELISPYKKLIMKKKLFKHCHYT